MNCRRAKSEMALRVGGDLDESSCHRLERHLAVCPACRSEWDRLRGAHGALRRCALASDSDFESTPRGAPGTNPAAKLLRASTPFEGPEPFESLWPGVSARLARRDASSPRREFNGWVPALWVTAAAVLVFVFTTGGPAPEPGRRDPMPVAPAWNVPGSSVEVLPARWPAAPTMRPVDAEAWPSDDEFDGLSPENRLRMFPRSASPHQSPVREATR